MRVYVFRLAMLTLAVLGPVVARGDDQQIAEQIIQKLDSEKQAGTLKGFSIDLSVEEGTVWLSGRVANAEQHARALDIARRIPGVKQVVNDLTVNGSTKNFVEGQAPVGSAPPAARAANRNQGLQPQAATTQSPGPVGGLFSNLGNAMQNAARRGTSPVAPAQQVAHQHSAVAEESSQPTATAKSNRPIGTGVASAAAPGASRRVVQAVLPVPNDADSEADLATTEPLTGESPHSVIARPVAIESVSPEPMPAVPAYNYAPPAYNYASRPVPVYHGSTSQVPLAYAPARQVQHEGAIMEGGGAPVPMHMAGSGVGIAPARYDHPSMPGYAWPSYAAYPNYAAVTYPKQYSPTAWPYIGPFYPYPQVPLGWRKVTLEWDDGWWMLDFKDRRSHTH